MLMVQLVKVRVMGHELRGSSVKQNVQNFRDMILFGLFASRINYIQPMSVCSNAANKFRVCNSPEVLDQNLGPQCRL